MSGLNKRAFIGSAALASFLLLTSPPAAQEPSSTAPQITPAISPPPSPRTGVLRRRKFGAGGQCRIAQHSSTPNSRRKKVQLSGACM